MIVGFWAAALAAAAYWVFVGFQLESLLIQVLDSTFGDRLFFTLWLPLSVVFTTYLLPPLAFAALLRLLRIRVGERTWAAPAMGYLLVVVLMSSEALIVEGDPWAYVPISVLLDGWLAMGVALGGLAVGSLLAKWILRRGPEPVVARAEAAGLTRAST